MRLDLESLNLFCHVMKDGSFSAAARSAKTSQPRISQQIAKLEARLGGRLFQRVGREVVPTPLARDLVSFASPLIDQITSFEESLEAQQATPRGKVRYAMPESCQWTPHYRAIMAKIAAYPEIRFDIRIQTNDAIVAGLRDGSLDFGFVCGERLATELRFEKFSDESYVAVARSREMLEDLPTGGAPRRLIAFPGWEQFYLSWAGRARAREVAQPAVWIGTLAGAVHAVQEGAGVAVLPYQCVMKELAEGTLHESRGARSGARPSNPIYLCRRVGEKQPRRVELVIEMLRQAKRELG